jgi:uncharacterized protein (TIGR02679 family)
MGTLDAVDALGRPELQRLWEAARRRLERNGRRITSNALELTELTDAELTGICALLGRRRPASNRLRVSLTELDSTLRASSAQGGLMDVLEALSGPVADRLAQRADERQHKAELWRAAEAHPLAQSEAVAYWLATIRQRGRLMRLAPGDPVELLVAALDCLAWLIANRAANVAQPIPLPALAAARLGNAHGLDPEMPLGALVADAVATMSGSTDVRSTWLGFGVQLDSVSASALAYQLPAHRGTIADAARANAEPLRITGRMLDRGLGLDIRPGDVVWVCENPSIVTLAADRLAAASRPLVCLEGMPSSVTGLLLSEIRHLGATLRVHTDFDFGGIAIMGHVTSRHGAEPWRMSRADYVAALDRPTTELEQRIGTTAWDPELSEAMNLHRRAAHEEAIVDILLADLAR